MRKQSATVKFRKKSWIGVKCLTKFVVRLSDLVGKRIIRIENRWTQKRKSGTGRLRQRERKSLFHCACVSNKGAHWMRLFSMDFVWTTYQAHTRNALSNPGVHLTNFIHFLCRFSFSCKRVIAYSIRSVRPLVCSFHFFPFYADLCWKMQKKESFVFGIALLSVQYADFICEFFFDHHVGVDAICFFSALKIENSPKKLSLIFSFVKFLSFPKQPATK